MRHVTIIPDCPECGKEMIVHGRYIPQIGEAFGKMVQHWECPYCGHTEPEADGRIEIEEFVEKND